MPIARRAVDGDAAVHQPLAAVVNIIDAVSEVAEIAAFTVSAFIPVMGQLNLDFFITGCREKNQGEPPGFVIKTLEFLQAEEIKKRTGEETIVSDLTYDLRSGSPDFVDKMVASTFAGMAMDLIAKGEKGLMMAINHGCYSAVQIPDPKLGPRKVDIESMYNTERYRPSYANKIGLPIFLTRA